MPDKKVLSTPLNCRSLATGVAKTRVDEGKPVQHRAMFWVKGHKMEPRESVPPNRVSISPVDPCAPNDAELTPSAMMTRRRALLVSTASDLRGQVHD
jgi:hypothetical protein